MSIAQTGYIDTQIVRGHKEKDAMQKPNLFSQTALIISFMILLNSCQIAPSPADGEVQDVRVQIVEPVRVVSKVEPFPLPNCGGTDRLIQFLGAYASANKSTTIGDKATATGGPEVGIPETIKLKLEIQVERTYQQIFESASSRVDSIEMAAAKGSHVVYTIVWEEQTFQSIVRYSADGNVYEVPYTYRLSVPKIDTSYTVHCANTGEITVAANTLLPVSTPSQPTATPALLIITPFCPFVTTGQMQELQTIQTVNDALQTIREFSLDSRYWEAGEVVPANVVIATDLGTANYQSFDVVPINNSGGWGLFLTTREITTPNDGAYWCVR